MNIIRQLRVQKGIQQKELAIEIGVSNATVSDWEHGRKKPSGERLKKLADFFGVEEYVILGQGTYIPDDPRLFVPIKPEISGKTETEQIVDRLLKQLQGQPRTQEAEIISVALDKMPKSERVKALNMLKAVYSEYFETEGEQMA